MCARVGEGYTKARATLSHCARKAELGFIHLYKSQSHSMAGKYSES